ncbi:MAG: membrane protein insertion efficiency factor YidD [Proteobacteria bacterium]|nr:membrane protein insertion efficiency factor YidD [Pseudomonadota bacterium]MCH9758992.1 membrane protein insertion efficiency factor YidD [Pseudomonadota bacterium]
MQILNKLACRLAILLILGYQRSLGLLLGGRCRFYPSCSEYARIVFTRFNFFTAFRLTLWRLLRCQPLCKGGEDLPPEAD